MAVPEPGAAPAPSEVQTAPAPSARAVAAAPVKAASDEDIWVELPEASEKPKRRRSRGKVKDAAEAVSLAPESVADTAAPFEASGDIAPEAAPVPEIETGSVAEAKAKRTRTRTRKRPEPKSAANRAETPVVEAEIQAEPAAPPAKAAEPATATAPQAVEATVVAPEITANPAEITAPLTKPRRGWWRRG